MKMFLMVLAAALIALTSVSPVLAAEPVNSAATNPNTGLPYAVLATEPLPQPVGAKRFYTQHELRMIQIYRINVNTDPNRVDFLEAPGDGAGGAGAGDGSGGGGDAGSSGSGDGGGPK